MISLYRVIQPVRDVEAAARFYGRVLGQAGERVSPGRHYFDCGGTILACYDPVADGDGLGDGWRHHFNQYVYFAVPDLDDTLARVRDSGGTIDAPIETMPWGERMFYAKDPFGNPISFVLSRQAPRPRRMLRPAVNRDYVIFALHVAYLHSTNGTLAGAGRGNAQDI